MLAQFCDSCAICRLVCNVCIRKSRCAICRLVAQCVDPQIALRDLQIAQIRRLRLTTVQLHFLIHSSNNRFFKLTVRTLKTDLSEFQGQNFKVRGTLGAEFVCFCIQALGAELVCFCI